MGELKNKTRILITHAVDFLHLADKIIVIKDGQLVQFGTFDSLKDSEYLLKLMQIHKTNQNE
jgi:ABC-type multidrug transport system fused ATPase/permease subunit